jgi:hypothetical protein
VLRASGAFSVRELVERKAAKEKIPSVRLLTSNRNLAQAELVDYYNKSRLLLLASNPR